MLEAACREITIQENFKTLYRAEKQFTETVLLWFSSVCDVEGILINISLELLINFPPQMEISFNEIRSIILLQHDEVGTREVCVKPDV